MREVARGGMGKRTRNSCWVEGSGICICRMSEKYVLVKVYEVCGSRRVMVRVVEVFN